MVWIQMKYIWRPYTIQLSVIVLHISSFVQSSEFCPVLSVLHLQVCPVQRIISSCLLLSRTSSVLSSPMNSVQSSVSVSHLQVCPVQWIPSSCLLLSHIFRFVKFSEFFPAVCYCLAHFHFCPVLVFTVLCLQVCPVIAVNPQPAVCVLLHFVSVSYISLYAFPWLSLSIFHWNRPI